MAFEPGGMVDKLGNRYEGRWVAKQLLRLLNEEIRSVIVELIGPDERGVDLSVVKEDGTRQLQQCKARSGRPKSWSVAALNDKEILINLKENLNRNPQREFVLVSPIPAQSIADICDRSSRIKEHAQTGTDATARHNDTDGEKRFFLIHYFLDHFSSKFRDVQHTFSLPGLFRDIL